MTGGNAEKALFRVIARTTSLRVLLRELTCNTGVR